MFEILDDTENGIVRVAYVGEIQATDYDVSGPTFEKIARRDSLYGCCWIGPASRVGARNPNREHSGFAYDTVVTWNELQLSVNASGALRQPNSIRS